MNCLHTCVINIIDSHSKDFLVEKTNNSNFVN